MLAAHIENLVFLLLVALAGLFQLLARAARKTSEDEEEPTSKPAPRMQKPIQRAPAESDQERIRKFLEALGQPPSSRPPPPAVPRADIPPRPLAPVRPPIPVPAPPWKRTRGETRKQWEILQESPPPEIARRAEKISAPAIRVSPAFDVHEEPLPPEQPPIIKKAFGLAKTEDLKTDIAILLASKSGLRDAIILREIFGPPRSMQALDLL